MKGTNVVVSEILRDRYAEIHLLITCYPNFPINDNIQLKENTLLVEKKYRKYALLFKQNTDINGTCIKNAKKCLKTMADIMVIYCLKISGKN